MTIGLRPATLGDAAGVAAVVAEGWTAFSSFLPSSFVDEQNRSHLARFQELLATSNPSSTMVLMVAVDTRDDGTEVVAGACTVGTTRQKPAAIKDLYAYELRCIYVHAAYHGQGLAKKLFQEALRAFHVPLDAPIFCNVFLKNVRACRFYEKLGAVEVYREANSIYSPEPETILTLAWSRAGDILTPPTAAGVASK
ncbi:hypothetical protein SPRG_05941 [Saprolegnia parasitica CBS 223.65]|uniref:N-acetyltransferase domain-containing protein n=1 Tax=Saprolegnia parasitica (strain CBS 223.65) TaxID=695850 RepID=A0A067CF65_SAPPC|nr:hypothetical protein SPRG_05941 [Saprolegnia parasitica CBS 223.65]KDO29404.1 hypothetical protein SPRG_05941 [Saprolegnia parasitica CBS 223.65]|eukprot:XP_012199906.1 hypothetical protein SPRG_05941 [Saprolegnia parasitica CBS 223.65]